MADVLGTIIALEGLAVVALSAFLVKRGFRRPGTWVLGGLLLAFGALLLVIYVPSLLAFTPPRGLLLFSLLAGVVVFTLNYAFAVVYPDWVLSTRKIWFLVWAAIPGLAILGALVLAPDLLLRSDGTPTLFLGELDEVLFAASFLPGTWVFGRHWLATEPGLYRRQFLFVLAPFLLWNLNDGFYGIVALFSPDLAGGRLPGIVTLLSAAQILSVATVAFLTLRRWLARRADAESARDDRFLLQMVAIGVPFALLQFLGFDVHVLVDGAIMALLFYGVAKYQVLDIDLKVKVTIKRGALGSAGLMIVFVVQQAVEQFVGAQIGGSYGLVLGALVAGVSLFALRPLEHAAHKLSEKAVGKKVEPTAAYLTFRKFEIYKVALEGMLRDGALDVREGRALKGLREELGISVEEHDFMEQELRQKLAPRAAPQAAPA